MSPKRGERAAPPPAVGEWDVRFAKGEAAKGWDDLCAQAPGNTREAWLLMRTDPTPAVRSSRHARLKGELGHGSHSGKMLQRWQIEVTAGGRIWYLADTEARIVWIDYASTRHPKITDS